MGRSTGACFEAVLAEPESGRTPSGVCRRRSPAAIPRRAELIRLQVELTTRRRTGAPVSDSLDLYRRPAPAPPRPGALPGAGRDPGPRPEPHLLPRLRRRDRHRGRSISSRRTLELYRLAPILHLDLSSAAKVIPAALCRPGAWRRGSVRSSLGKWPHRRRRRSGGWPRRRTSGRLTWLDLSGNDNRRWKALEALAASPKPARPCAISTSRTTALPIRRRRSPARDANQRRHPRHRGSGTRPATSWRVTARAPWLAPLDLPLPARAATRSSRASCGEGNWFRPRPDPIPPIQIDQESAAGRVI